MPWTDSLQRHRTLLVSGVLALLVLWLYTAFILAPLMRQASGLGRKVRSARTQLQQLEQAVAREGALREQHQHVSQALAGMQEVLPDEEQLPAVLERVTQLARQSQVRVHTIFPQRPIVREAAREREKAPSPPTAYQDFLIEIDAQAGYHQLGGLLTLIESEPQPMRLASLRILTDPKDPRRHRIKLVIRSYFAPPGGRQRTAGS